MNHEMDPDCLHCKLQHLIEQHAQTKGDRGPKGEVAIDVAEVAACFGQAVGNLLALLPARHDRRKFKKYARECLEAGFRFGETGKPQEVGMDTLETEH